MRESEVLVNPKTENEMSTTNKRLCWKKGGPPSEPKYTVLTDSELVP